MPARCVLSPPASDWNSDGLRYSGSPAWRTGLTGSPTTYVVADAFGDIAQPLDDRREVDLAGLARFAVAGELLAGAGQQMRGHRLEFQPHRGGDAFAEGDRLALTHR